MRSAYEPATDRYVSTGALYKIQSPQGDFLRKDTMASLLYAAQAVWMKDQAGQAAMAY